MKKAILACLLPVGLFLYAAYNLYTHLVQPLPDAAAYLIMVSSILLMLGGIFYTGWRWERKEKPTA